MDVSVIGAQIITYSAVFGAQCFHTLGVRISVIPFSQKMGMYYTKKYLGSTTGSQRSVKCDKT